MKTRASRDGRVWVVERANWKTIDSLSLPGSGNVHEIRILDEPDLCHHGHVFRGHIATLGSPHDADPVAKVALARSSANAGATAATDRWEQHVAFARLNESQGTAAEFSLATLTAWQARDVVVRAHVDLREAGARHTGLVARYQGPGDSNMLVAMVAKADTTCRAQLWRQQEGQWSCLKTAKLRRRHGMLELNMLGQTACLSFDGTKVFEVTVAGPVQAGRVGVRSARGTFADFQAESRDAAQQHTQRKVA